VELLNKEALSVTELAKITNKSSKAITDSIESLKKNGYCIDLNGGRYKVNKCTLERPETILLPYYEKTIKIGIVSDTHSGSSHEQLTHLNSFYDICYAKNVPVVLNAGDITAGVNMYRGQQFECHHYGADPQKDWCVKTYPSRPGITTHVIAGNHDGSYLNSVGLNIVKAICVERPDMKYTGFCAGEILLESGLKIELLHPDGGVPYAQSYRAQKINEARGRGEHVPDLAIYGHMHISLFNPYLGVYDLCAGCFEGQNTWLRRRGLNPEIGGWILEINYENGMITRLQPEWFPFKEIKDDWKNF